MASRNQINVDKSFSLALKALPKQIRDKVEPTINLLTSNPELPGLHVEKLSNNDVYSARIDDNYRIIFQWPNRGTMMFLLYVGPHDNAYCWAKKHTIDINPTTGGREVKKSVPDRIIREESSKQVFSRLSQLWDKHLQKLKVPEELWPLIRTRVFTKAQLTSIQQSIPEEAYITLESILAGQDIEDAMNFYEDVLCASINNYVIQARESSTPLFDAITDADLMKIGIPQEYIERVRLIKSDLELSGLEGSIPDIAMQSLYAIRSGKTPEEIYNTTFKTSKPVPNEDYATAINNPITLAECASISNQEALHAIIEYPAEMWRVFLHPIQQMLVKANYNGPARIIGRAGTGKTIVIVHRAKYLASQCAPDKKVLVTTFTKTLSADLDRRIKSLCSEEEYSRIRIIHIDKLTSDYLWENKRISIMYDHYLLKVWESALKASGQIDRFNAQFCMEEWEDVIQGQNITTLEQYLSAQRKGRGRQFDRKMREEIWNVFGKYKVICQKRKIVDSSWAQNMLVETLNNHPDLQEYQSILVDESQDLRAPAFRMLRALAGQPHTNDLYLTGDARQRIYRGSASLSKCGIVINNRSHQLNLNYRSTAEIYEAAMRVQQRYHYDNLDEEEVIQDNCTCIFHGPAPIVKGFETKEEEINSLCNNIRWVIESGTSEKDICIVARKNRLLKEYAEALDKKGINTLILTSQQVDDDAIPGVRLATMHRTKGMEFTCVFIVSVNQGVIPITNDVSRATKEDTLEELEKNEANLISVAMTRARKYVWLSYYGKPSKFLSSFR